MVPDEEIGGAGGLGPFVASQDFKDLNIGANVCVWFTHLERALSNVTFPTQAARWTRGWLTRTRAK